MLISGFVGLAYEGISSFLHNRRHNALHKAVRVIDKQATIQHNKLMHLEDSMVMYGIHNAETLENLIHTIYCMHNSTTEIEKLFAGQLNSAYTQYINTQGTQYYAIDSLLYLRTIKDKYIPMYKEFITQLCIYTKEIRILAKGYLPILLITPIKLKEILAAMKTTIQKTNPYYDLVIKHLHLYYDMKLVTFSRDRDRNLTIQFPIFIQPYTQQPLVLY